MCEVQLEVCVEAGLEMGTLIHTVIQGSRLIDIMPRTTHSFRGWSRDQCPLAGGERGEGVPAL